MLRLHSKKFLTLTALAALLLVAARAQTPAPATPQQKKTTTASKTKSKAAAPAVKEKEIIKSVGSKAAPVTMEVFSDYQCPACQNLYFQTIRPMMNDYVHSGRVFYIHRDNPLAMHPYARDAARMACAAAQIGKFEKVVDAIYGSQSVWSSDRSKLELAVASVLTPAELSHVRTSMNSPAVQSSIENDLSLGRRVPVGSTPTVVLTHKGQRITLPSGVSYPLLKRVLDQLLSQR